MHGRLGRAALALAAAVFSVGVAGALDKVVLSKRGARSSKQSHTGNVTRDDADGVTIEFVGEGGGEIQLKRAEVKEVVYDIVAQFGGRPPDYHRGLSAFRAGKYGTALSFFEAAKEAPHDKLLTQYILYYTGRCLRQLRKPGEAVAVFQKLKKKGNDTRFLTDAYVNLLELYLEMKNVGNAKKILGVAKKKQHISEEQSYLMDGRIAEAARNYRGAKKFYTKAAEIGRRETSGRACLGIARCDMGLRNPDGAAKAISKLVKQPYPDEVLAEAYVILGDALKATAKTDEQLADARDAYLHVHLLYGGNEETEAKALYQAAATYRRIDGPNSSVRAGQLMAKLRELYPNYEPETP